MTDKHLSEEDLQVYVTHPEQLSAEVRGHAAGCNHCRQEIDAYRQIITAIGEQPSYRFDIDLSAVVLEKIQPEKERSIRKLWLPVLITVIVIIPVYIFRKNFLYLFSGLSDVFIMLCGLLFCGTLAVKGIQLYHHYRKQLDKINFLQ